MTNIEEYIYDTAGRVNLTRTNADSGDYNGSPLNVSTNFIWYLIFDFKKK
jgi:hypothetical protein